MKKFNICSRELNKFSYLCTRLSDSCQEIWTIAKHISICATYNLDYGAVVCMTLFYVLYHIYK